MTGPIDQDLHDLFVAYARAFDAFDAVGIAAFYHLPCFMVHAGGVALFETHNALLQNMEELVAIHRQQDYGRAASGVLRVTDLGDGLAIVTVPWTIHTRAETVLWQFGTTYNVLRALDGWKILVATTHAAG